MNKIHSNGKRFFAPAIAAGLMLAMAFTLNACGGDGGGDEVPASSSSGSGSSSSGTSSSSSGGDTPSSSSQPPPKCGEYNQAKQFCDERGEKLYKYVEINGQTWMAENLNFNADGSKCYDEDEGKCADYGRLYDWATAMNLEASCNSSVCSSQIQLKHQGVCPSGWHIPSGAEWQALVDFAGGGGTAGTKLKSTSGWNAHATYGDGTDDYGFSALPGGFGTSDGYFNYAGDHGSWWSASEDYSDYAYNRGMDYYGEYASWGSLDKGYLFSVRCVQD
jgi:uncharacterized protein (TIGR02145 family)